MSQVFTSSAAEIKEAKWPHELFLMNLVFNHSFLFIISIAVYKSLPMMLLSTPLLSAAIIAYIIAKEKMIAASDASYFLKGHWKITAVRNIWFLYLLIFTCAISGGGYYLFTALGLSKISLWAIVIGVGLLPFMIVLLALITLGSDSINFARDGKLPDNYLAKYPPPSN